MPRINRKEVEKSSDFFGSIKRLIKNLNPWKYLLILAIFLATSSAILALISPNKLSSLTDEITKGVTLDTQKLNENIFNVFQKNINLKVDEIKNSKEISDNDKEIFLNIIKEEDKNNILKEMPESCLKVLLEDVTINDKVITVDDEISYLKSEDLNNLPTKIMELISPKMNFTRIKSLAIFIGILYITSSIFSYIESFSMTTISNKFAKSLRTKISNKINKLPLKYFDTHEQGDVLSRVTNDIDIIAQNLNNSLATLVTSITLFLGSLLMMFITNGIMAITAILSSLIGFAFMSIVLFKSQKYFTKRQEELGNINGYIEEMYSGLNVVKTYNGDKEAIKRFGNLNDKLYNANRKSEFLSGLMMPFMGFIGNLGYVAVCIVGALLVAKGTISFGIIIAFIVYVRLFNNPLSQMAQAMSALQSTAAAGERVFEFLDEEEMPLEDKLTKYLAKDKVKGKIEFKNVSFGYNKDKTIIHDFNVHVNPGDKIAIVGPTGAGKTTLVNLLMKFYEINAGDILIDGISIHDLTRENIHELFCMVLQDTWLFDGTIKENIKFNKENVDDSKIWEACKSVGVDHFIKTLPGGLNAKISDNDTVSSGQKQLFTIARGNLEEAPFLILDEATSNVDTRTEELVQKAMDKLTIGRTSFIIAHRLSTIKNADLILVMNEGNIIEQGTHNELMKKNGFYASLYNSQFEI